MKPRILVVDDDPDLIQLLQFNLEQQGCEILIAPNGLEGLKLARTDVPDLILLDLMLPDLEGLSVCEILQTQRSTRDIPIFIVSALDQSWVKTRKSRAKFSAYFTKPIALTLLKESVLSICNHRMELLHSRLTQLSD